MYKKTKTELRSRWGQYDGEGEEAEAEAPGQSRREKEVPQQTELLYRIVRKHTRAPPITHTEAAPVSYC